MAVPKKKVNNFIGELSFADLFYFLSLFYFICFYFIPLALIFFKGGVVYYFQETYRFDSIRIFGGFLYGAIFFTFFTLAHFYINRSKSGAYVRPKPMKVGRKITVFAILFILFYCVYNLMYIDLDYIYAQKRDEVEGNHILFLASIIFGALGSFLAIKLDEVGRSKMAFLMLSVIVVAAFFSGAGRYSVLILISMMIILFFGIKINKKMFLLGVVVSFLIIPLVLNLKEIIYRVGIGSELSIDLLFDFYSFEGFADSYILNFGHPVLSFLLAEDTIKITGYRFFYDYIQGFLFYFKLFGIDAGYSLAYFNTFTFLGAMKSIVPPGYIAFGFIQAHFLGVIVSGFFYALIGFMCNAVRIRVAPDSQIAKFYFAFTAANTFYHGEVRLIVMTVFLGLFLMLAFNYLVNMRFKY